VLLIEAEERGRLAQLLNLRFRPLVPRRVGLGLWARLRRATARGREKAADAWARIRHPGSGRPLGDAALGAAERSLLQALRAAAPGVRVALTEGAGPPRRVDGGFRLPRQGPLVARAVRAVAADTAWAYPAALSLLEPGPDPAAEAVASWRERLERGDFPSVEKSRV
jgi:hypothetical protein